MTEIKNEQTVDEEAESKVAMVERSIIVRRLCADGEPLGKTVPKLVRSADITIQNDVVSESSNEQTTDGHSEEQAHQRTRKDTIKRVRTHDCTTFARDQSGEIDRVKLTELLEQKLFGAFRNTVPTYLNSADQGRILSSISIKINISKVGATEPEPETQMVETNGMTKGTIWRYAEVLSNVEAQVTFASFLLQRKKLLELTQKTLSQRIGKFHNVKQSIGTIEVK